MAKLAAAPAEVALSAAGFGLAQLGIRGFRSARAVSFEPRTMCALVGEANAGKSNLLAAIRTLLDPGAPPIGHDDLSVGGDGSLTVRGVLASGETLVLEASPPAPPHAKREAAPSVLFLPAGARAGSVLAETAPHDGKAVRALDVFRSALGEQLLGVNTEPAETARASSTSFSIGRAFLETLIRPPRLLENRTAWIVS